MDKSRFLEGLGTREDKSSAQTVRQVTKPVTYALLLPVVTESSVIPSKGRAEEGLEAKMSTSRVPALRMLKFNIQIFHTRTAWYANLLQMDKNQQFMRLHVLSMPDCEKSTSCSMAVYTPSARAPLLTWQQMRSRAYYRAFQLLR